MFWNTTIKELNEQDTVRYEYDLYLGREIVKLDKKIDLILKEIGKEYVPEKDTTEPAKLVDKSDGYGHLGEIYDKWIAQELVKQLATKPKKKRGRPKKK